MLKHFAVWGVVCATAFAQSNRPCTQFSVVTQDMLKNLKQGIVLRTIRNGSEKK